MDLLEQKKISSANFKRHPWELARFQILSFLLARISPKNFIVDVGSGDAFIATRLAQTFTDSRIAAVDINYDDQFIFENEKPNLFFSKNIHNLKITQHVDAVLLMDVLEHIQNPGKTLYDIKDLEKVSTSTQFFITVPAFENLFSEHDVFLKHVKRYNRKQLIQLLHKQGFEIKYNGYFFFSLLLPRCFQKIFGIRSKPGLHNWNGGHFLTSIMTNLLWIDFKICWYLSRIGINLPGLSCYCICHPLP
jgi:hypothetical protein